MIEYLLNAIRATAGEDITVMASITKDDIPIEDGCGFMLHIDEENVVMVDGVYDDELDVWTFTIPADATKGLKGRYSYCFCQGGKTLCFREPFYLM